MDEVIFDNILFLDYDGVINTENDNFNGQFDNPEAIYYIGKFCMEYNFQIVVTSSWKHNPNYKDFLYNSGLDKKITIIGCTESTFKGREYEIKKYLKKHPQIKKYIIIDDAYISGELGLHQIQTSYRIGYTKNKYLETVNRFNKLYN